MNLSYICYVFAHLLLAGGMKSSGSTDGASGIFPKLSSKSDKKFFGKDYPLDERPPPDKLHFNHPYPQIQASSEFDKDYPKDENSDNGGWKAQSEYDRLRNKLRKEKHDVAKGKRRKEKAEERLKRAIERMKAAQRAATATTSQRPKETSNIGVKHDVVDKDEPEQIPGGIANPADVKIRSATKDTTAAVDGLEDCKKELADAREALKELMKELETAKNKQIETEKALDKAVLRKEEAEADKKRLDNAVKDDYKDYMDSRNEYLRQQATVAKMENDLKVAAEKVKKIRGGQLYGAGYGAGGDEESNTMCLLPEWISFSLILFAAINRF